MQSDNPARRRPIEVLGGREFIAMMALLMALQALAIDAMLPGLGQCGAAERLSRMTRQGKSNGSMHCGTTGEPQTTTSRSVLHPFLPGRDNISGCGPSPSTTRIRARLAEAVSNSCPIASYESGRELRQSSPRPLARRSGSPRVH